MRPRFLLPVALFCLAMVSPTFLRAQFQQPTKEELAMTADPKAAGEAAVYLYSEETTDDAYHFHSYYERIKVLTEKGKELATVRIPYEHGVDTVTDVQGRTIHADGTIIPLTAKPADLMDYKSKLFQVNTVVFTLPSVEVGSILEYRLKVRAPDYRISEPQWNIQKQYPVRKSHYSFHTHVVNGVMSSDGESLSRLMYTSKLQGDAKVTYEPSKELYWIDLDDVPAMPAEDWMPPMNTLKWRVQFYYTNAATGPAFWVDAGKRWARRTQEFSNPSNGLKKSVADIIAPQDTEDQKARKIYAAVQKLDNTAFSRTKSQVERKKEKIKDIHNAEDVWKQKSGTDDEITLLFVAMARAAGLKVSPLQVVDRNRAMFDNRYLSTAQLDDYLAVVTIDGKEIFLDPGQRMCPFGALHWKHSLATGFRLNDKDVVPVTTPAGPYKAAVLQRIADLHIDPLGALEGTVRFVMTGPDALYWRQIALENDQEEVKKKFNESVRDEFPDGVQADFDHFLSLDDYNVNLVATVKVSGSIGNSTGKHVFLPELFFESHAKHPFVAQDKRTTPIDVHYARMESDDVTYHLPPGYTIESVPQAASASWPDHALLKIGSRLTSDGINVARNFAYNYTLLGPQDYPSVHDFYQKVATADQQQLVLTRAQIAKGN